jgi:hypothetical protein
MLDFMFIALGLFLKQNKFLATGVSFRPGLFLTPDSLFPVLQRLL